MNLIIDLFKKHNINEHLKKTIQSYSGIEAENIQFNVIKGNNQEDVLRLYVYNQKEGEALVNYFFEACNIISRNNSRERTKKTLTKNNTQSCWMIHLTLPDVVLYCKNIGLDSAAEELSALILNSNDIQPVLPVQEKIGPTSKVEESSKLVLNSNVTCPVPLNQFLQSQSLKEHFEEIMAEKHEKGAVIRCSALDNPERVRIKIRKNKAYATDLLNYLKEQVPGLSIDLQLSTTKKKKIDRYIIELAASEFFSYVSKVQINGLYFHHTLPELFQALQKKAKKIDDYNHMLTLAAQALLGKFCHQPDDSKSFKPLHITLAVIEDYLQCKLGLKKPEDASIDIEEIMTAKLEQLIDKENIFLKAVIIKSTGEYKAIYSNINFTLQILNDPGSHGRNYQYEKNKHTKTATHKYDPRDTPEKSDEINNYCYRRHSENIRNSNNGAIESSKLYGIKKPYKLFTKKTAVSMPPQNLGATNRFTQKSYHQTLFLFDIEECEIHHKYIFEKNAKTNFQPHYVEIKANSASAIELYKAKTSTIKRLREKNQTSIKTRLANSLIDFNEILAGLPKKGPRGLAAIEDNLENRIITLAVAFKIKKDLKLDYEIPVIIAPLKEEHKRYTYEQRIKDIIQVVKNTNNALPEFLILLIKENNYLLFRQISEHYAPRIKNENLLAELKKTCCDINLNPKINLLPYATATISLLQMDTLDSKQTATSIIKLLKDANALKNEQTIAEIVIKITKLISELKTKPTLINSITPILDRVPLDVAYKVLDSAIKYEQYSIADRIIVNAITDEIVNIHFNRTSDIADKNRLKGLKIIFSKTILSNTISEELVIKFLDYLNNKYPDLPKALADDEELTKLLRSKNAIAVKWCIKNLKEWPPNNIESALAQLIKNNDYENAVAFAAKFLPENKTIKYNQLLAQALKQFSDKKHENEVAKILCKRGADITEQDADGQSLLSIADAALAISVLSNNITDLKKPEKRLFRKDCAQDTEQGAKLLRLSIVNGASISVIEFLILAGADAGYKVKNSSSPSDNEKALTAFETACLNKKWLACISLAKLASETISLLQLFDAMESAFNKSRNFTAIDIFLSYLKATELNASEIAEELIKKNKWKLLENLVLHINIRDTIILEQLTEKIIGSIILAKKLSDNLVNSFHTVLLTLINAKKWPLLAAYIGILKKHKHCIILVNIINKSNVYELIPPKIQKEFAIFSEKTSSNHNNSFDSTDLLTQKTELHLVKGPDNDIHEPSSFDDEKDYCKKIDNNTYEPGSFDKEKDHSEESDDDTHTSSSSDSSSSDEASNNNRELKELLKKPNLTLKEFLSFIFIKLKIAVNFDKNTLMLMLLELALIDMSPNDLEQEIFNDIVNFIINAVIAEDEIEIAENILRNFKVNLSPEHYNKLTSYINLKHSILTINDNPTILSPLPIAQKNQQWQIMLLPKTEASLTATELTPEKPTTRVTFSIGAIAATDFIKYCLNTHFNEPSNTALFKAGKLEASLMQALTVSGINASFNKTDSTVSLDMPRKTLKEIEILYQSYLNDMKKSKYRENAIDSNSLLEFSSNEKMTEAALLECNNESSPHIDSDKSSYPSKTSSMEATNDPDANALLLIELIKNNKIDSAKSLLNLSIPFNLNKIAPDGGLTVYEIALIKSETSFLRDLLEKNQASSLDVQLFKKIFKSAIQKNNHDIIKLLLSPIYSSHANAIKELATESKYIIGIYLENPGVKEVIIEAVNSNNLNYLEWACANGIKVTTKMLNSAIRSEEVASLETLLRSNNIQIKPSQISKITASKAKGKINNFSIKTSNIKEKRLSATELSYHQIQQANTVDEVMNIIKALEEDKYNYFTKKAKRSLFKKLFGFYWNDKQVSTKYSWLIKAAKNKLLDLCIAQDQKITDGQKNFLSKNRRIFPFQTKSSEIYDLYFLSKKKGHSEKAKDKLKQEKEKESHWHEKIHERLESIAKRNNVR